VLGITLPDGSGLDLFQRIRQTPELHSIRVFLLFSEFETQERLSAERLGADLHISKPYDRGFVLQAARQLLKTAGGSVPVGLQRSAGPCRLLVVDDSLTFREALAYSLRKEGYEVTLAASGEHALLLSSVEYFDGILLDVVMPGLSGIETCRLLRSRSAMAKVPLLLMTSSEEELSLAETSSPGASEIVMKPDNLSALGEKVQQLISYGRISSRLQYGRTAT
jgi:DNA-binding response OmpR family regulator